MDPLRYMCEMRQDRGGIIQTAVSYWLKLPPFNSFYSLIPPLSLSLSLAQDQYVYIHKVLKDYMASKPQ